MSSPHFTRPPQALRKAALDNILIVPASLLPFKAQYQQIANQLPRGGILIVSPRQTSQVKAMQHTASLLRAKGHSVKLVSARM